MILDPIDAYLETPNAEQWAKVHANFENVLGKVVDVEQRLKDERSDFVLETEFSQLLETVHARGGLLKKLMKIDPPQQEAELQELRLVRDKYAELIATLDRTRLALDAYLSRVGE